MPRRIIQLALMIRRSASIPSRRSFAPLPSAVKCSRFARRVLCSSTARCWCSPHQQQNIDSRRETIAATRIRDSIVIAPPSSPIGRAPAAARSSLLVVLVSAHRVARHGVGVAPSPLVPIVYRRQRRLICSQPLEATMSVSFSSLRTERASPRSQVQLQYALPQRLLLLTDHDVLLIDLLLEVLESEQIAGVLGDDVVLGSAQEHPASPGRALRALLVSRSVLPW